MASLNKVLLIGRLGKDPELRSTGQGKSVVNFSLATGTGDYTEWTNVVAFDKTADLCNRYLRKGSQAYIEGELRTRKWQAKDGTDRYTTEVIARMVQFLDSKGEQSEPANESYQSAAGATIDDEDIPF